MIYTIMVITVIILALIAAFILCDWARTTIRNVDDNVFETLCTIGGTPFAIAVLILLAIIAFKIKIWLRT